MEFNQDGELLATGDKGGRVVIFQVGEGGGGRGRGAGGVRRSEEALRRGDTGVTQG